MVAIERQVVGGGSISAGSDDLQRPLSNPGFQVTV